MLIYLVSSEKHFGGEIAGYGRGLLEAAPAHFGKPLIEAEVTDVLATFAERERVA